MSTLAILNVVVAILVPPLLVGVINKTKALFGGRLGPPVLQLYYDLWKLARKDMVFSRSTTWVFRAGPAVGLASSAAAALLVPQGQGSGLVSFAGDMLLLVYLLALGRFFTASAALDTASPFEGMGAAREVTFACLAEPALLLGLFVLARLTDSLSLSGMLAGDLSGGWAAAAGSLVLVLGSWFIVLLAEGCRVPFDDPNTHLELTMVHEVMVLDHSGPALAMILYGASLKLFVVGSLVAGVALAGATADPWLDWGLHLGMLLVIAVAVGVVESTMARLRLIDIPKLLVTACLLAAFGVVLQEL